MISILLLIVSIASAITSPDTSEADARQLRIGPALSGGAALGLAHIGVLKVLEREGIPVSCIAGNSMGSLVGGAYAAGYSAAVIESIAVHADFSVLFSSGMPFGAQYLPERQQSQRYIIELQHRNLVPALPSGLVPLQNVEFTLMDLLSEIEFNTYYDFDRLPIPYRAIAVDLKHGELLTLKQGRLQQAIRASIAIPGVFSPEIIDTLELVDGGVQQFLPVEPLFEFKPDLIIASTTVRSQQQRRTGGLIDIITRTMDLINICDYREQLSYADIVIAPDVDQFMSSEFHRARELIDAGETAAERALPAIRKRLQGKKPDDRRNAVLPRPLPVIRSIRFQGFETTRIATVSSLVRTAPGVKLDFSRLHNDLKALYHTDLFEDINYKIEFAGQDSVDIVFEVKEREYGFYALGMRYDNTDKVVLGIEAGQSNMWGLGASIRAALNLGNPRELRFGLTGTRLFAFPFGYRIDTYRGSVTRPYYEDSDWLTDYTIIYHGALIEAGYILGHNAFFDVGMSVRQAVYRLPQVPGFDTLPSSEWMIGPAFRLEYNTHDDLHLPRKGAAFTIAADYSSGKLKSARDFVRIDASMRRYLPVSERFLIVPGFDIGLCFGTPAWASYFLTGGADFVGFEHGHFTTENRTILHLGFEYRLFNLLHREDYPLYLQLLSSIGTFERPDDVIRSGDIRSHLHWGVGAGVRTNTPIGPFALVIGAADIDKQDLSGTRVNYHVSIGREFRY
ncbi:patatin-like phospholipase family protein [candidate division WOR-3 bacterium]|nr:patatin-like phospholipase family protein [candidate division WOR-3 bacterium]